MIRSRINAGKFPFRLLNPMPHAQHLQLHSTHDKAATITKHQIIDSPRIRFFLEDATRR